MARSHSIKSSACRTKARDRLSSSVFQSWMMLFTTLPCSNSSSHHHLCTADAWLSNARKATIKPREPGGHPLHYASRYCKFLWTRIIQRRKNVSHATRGSLCEREIVLFCIMHVQRNLKSWLPNCDRRASICITCDMCKLVLATSSSSL